MKRTTIIPFAKEEDPQMSKCGTLVDPVFSSCLYQVESYLGDLRNVRIAIGFAQGTLCVWKIF